jgi:hypothetical protein
MSIDAVRRRRESVCASTRGDFEIVREPVSLSMRFSKTISFELLENGRALTVSPKISKYGALAGSPDENLVQ